MRPPAAFEFFIIKPSMPNDKSAQSKWSWSKSRASEAGRSLLACLSGKPLDMKFLYHVLSPLDLNLRLYLA